MEWSPLPKIASRYQSESLRYLTTKGATQCKLRRLVWTALDRYILLAFTFVCARLPGRRDSGAGRQDVVLVAGVAWMAAGRNAGGRESLARSLRNGCAGGSVIHV